MMMCGFTSWSIGILMSWFIIRDPYWARCVFFVGSDWSCANNGLFWLPDRKTALWRWPRMDFIEFPSGTGRVRWGLRVFWVIFRGCWKCLCSFCWVPLLTLLPCISLPLLCWRFVRKFLPQKLMLKRLELEWSFKYSWKFHHVVTTV